MLGLVVYHGKSSILVNTYHPDINQFSQFVVDIDFVSVEVVNRRKANVQKIEIVMKGSLK